MAMTLGQQVKKAREDKGYSLATVCENLADFGAGSLDAGTLRKMELGDRPGDVRVWGALWRFFQLPLRDLYEGLDLPVPDEMPAGTLGRLLAVAGGLPRQGQDMVLAFARQTPTYLALAGMEQRLEAPVELTAEESEREALLSELHDRMKMRTTAQLRAEVANQNATEYQGAQGVKPHRHPQASPAIRRIAGD